MVDIQATRLKARIFLFSGVFDVVLGVAFLLWGHALFPADAPPVLGLRLEQLIGVCLIGAALVPLAIGLHASRKLESARRAPRRGPAGMN